MTSILSTRPSAAEFPQAYAGYVASAPDGSVLASLETEGQATLAVLRGIDEDRSLHRYAPGKWSIREVTGHLADAERVFAYRAMTFARADAGPVPGFDENAWVPAAESDRQPFSALIDLYATTRAATLSLLRTLPEAAWTRSGTANGKTVSVRALAWVIVGHDVHHRKVLLERYLGVARA